MADWNDKPLAAASRNLRHLARERKVAERDQVVARAAEAGVPPPPPPTGIDDVADEMRRSRTLHERKLATVRTLFDRVAGQCSTAQLDRLIGALELFARGMTR